MSSSHRSADIVIEWLRLQSAQKTRMPIAPNGLGRRPPYSVPQNIMLQESNFANVP